MRRFGLLITAALLSFTASASDPIGTQERVVFRTNAGDLVFAFYPKVAPNHVAQFLKLCRLGGYDSTQFFRVVPGFVAQVTDADSPDRLDPIDIEAYESLVPIPLENSHLHHRRGTLSMAKADGSPTSSPSSFSVLLGDAPHLDGEYTVFGYMTAGFDVLREIERAAIAPDSRPLTRITIEKVWVFKDAASLDGFELRRAVPLPKGEVELAEIQSAKIYLYGVLVVAAILLAAILIVSFVLKRPISRRLVRSILLLELLLAIFSVFVVAFPLVTQRPWITAVFAGCVMFMFKLMSSFETPK